MANPLQGSPFHAGEKRMQQLAGVTDIEAFARSIIRPFMPEQHRAFFAVLPQVYVASRDQQGRPWASLLYGPPGFVRSPNPKQLRLDPVLVRTADPINLEVGQQLGFLGLEMHTRRRNRMNGRVLVNDGQGLLLHVDQSFGNCPKYIQARFVQWDITASSAAADPPPSVLRGEGSMMAEQQRLVEAADTFFTASSYDGAGGEGEGSAPESRGCDASHRGGPPGFVQVLDGGKTLLWPDYSGNNMFQTLGNLLVNPRLGLLFVEYSSGETLQVTGSAEVVFGSLGLPGAKRALRFSVDEFVHVKEPLPLRVTRSKDYYSPYLPAPVQNLASGAAADRHVTCVGVKDEAAGIKSFFFRAPPGLRYLPGQYASFEIEVNGDRLNRTWTISSHPSELQRSGSFSITVKRAGQASTWLHENMAPGRQLQLRGVEGSFTPRRGFHPVLLLAGGIGITPLRAMLPHFLAYGADIALVYSVKDMAEAAFLSEFGRSITAGGLELNNQVAVAAQRARDVPSFRVICTSTGAGKSRLAQEAPMDVGERRSRHTEGLPLGLKGRTGRVSKEMLADEVPGIDSRHVYMCGPEPFMESAAAMLEGFGVPAESMYQESFNF